ncbi:MAG: hypothetical protein A2Z09_02115 [Nitrospirae bacterium RBG_16_43_8]|nr:MAG: hypothetical protein A2Z09_02115 [Nitrospirae bacterium RBG_16_43_8]
MFVYCFITGASSDILRYLITSGTESSIQKKISDIEKYTTLGLKAVAPNLSDESFFVVFSSSVDANDVFLSSNAFSRYASLSGL